MSSLRFAARAVLLATAVALVPTSVALTRAVAPVAARGEAGARFLVELRADAPERTQERARTQWLAQVGQGEGVALRHARTLATGTELVIAHRTLDPAAAKRLMLAFARDPRVRSVEIDHVLAPGDAPDAALEARGLAQAWARGRGAGVVVAVLGGSDVRGVAGKDRLPVQDFVRATATCRAPARHGSAMPDQVAGVAPRATVLPVRVAGACGMHVSDLAEAIVWSTGGHVAGIDDNRHPAEVVALSATAEAACGATLQHALQAAHAAGAVVVAEGTRNDARTRIPARCDHVVLADGEPAAYVAGVAALMQGIRAQSPEQVGTQLRSSSKPASGGAKVAPAAAAATVVTPVLSIADPTFVVEGNSGTKTLRFVASLSAAIDKPVTFTLATRNGTATAGSDYVAVAPVVATIAAGATTYNLDVVINGDTVGELDEDFHVDLTQASATNVADASARGEIRNDDGTQLANGVGVVVPATTTGTRREYFIVVPDGGSGLVVQTAGGTGDADVYVRAGAPATRTVYDCASAKVGNAESCTLPQVNGIVHVLVDTLNAFDGVVVTASHAPPSRVSIMPARVTEGASGTQTLTFTVHRALASPLATTFSVVAEAGGTAVAGVDFVPQTLTGLSMPGDVFYKEFSMVVAKGDTTEEADETFILRMKDVIGAAATTPTAIATLVNDDGASFEWDPYEKYGFEGNGVRVYFKLNYPYPEHDVTFHVTSVDGTAKAGLDYEAVDRDVTIPGGGFSTYIDIPLFQDGIAETDELFSLETTPVSGIASGHPPRMLRIMGSTGTPMPTLTMDRVDVAEGNAGSKMVPVTLRLSAPVNAPVTFDLTTLSGTAQPGTDFGAFALTGVTIPPGELTTTVFVAIGGDTTVEANEKFYIQTDNVTNADNQYGDQVTIRNDDGPTLSINDVTLAEGNAGTKQMTFTVTMPAAATVPVSYDIAPATNGTATAGSDFTATARHEILAPGETSRAYTVTVVGDTQIENDETVIVELTNLVGATAMDGVAVGKIANDEFPSLTIADVAYTEKVGTTESAWFTPTLSATAPYPVTLRLRTTGAGNATVGVDYDALALTDVIIPAGMLSTIVPVPIHDDTTVEATEYYVVAASDVVGAVVLDGTALGSILDNDKPSLSIADASVTEGNAGTANAVFTVSVSKPAPYPITFNYSVANGTAGSAGGDYVNPGVVAATLPANQASTTVSVAVNGDTAIETNETFTVTLASPVGATILDGAATGTITNDDTPTISIADANATEGHSGTKGLTFTVSLSQPAPFPVSFDVATTGAGDATAGVDYVAKTTQRITILASLSSTTFNVIMNGDTTMEKNELLVATIANVSGARIYDGAALGTIVNDDFPLLSISDLDTAEGNVTKQGNLTVTLSQAAPFPVTFSFDTEQGTSTSHPDYPATAGVDYGDTHLDGITIPAGTVSKVVSFPILGDNQVENDEYVVGRISDAVGATIDKHWSWIVIRNDDNAFLSIGDVRITEGDGNSKIAKVTVQLSQPSSMYVGFTVRATGAGSATLGMDYADVNWSYYLQPGQTTLVQDVVILSDELIEADEAFVVALEYVTGAQVADGTALVTIADDDLPNLSIADVTTTEGNAGTKSAVFTVALSQPAPYPVTFNLATTGAGTATAGTDYVAKSLSGLQIPAGQTAKTVAVTINGDTTVEATETYVVSVTGVLRANVADGAAIGRITNDD